MAGLKYWVWLNECRGLTNRSRALLLDHFGWAGYRESPVSPAKLAGLGLVVAGIALIQRG